MKIFIAGCGRSGTKALRIQMQGLSNSIVYKGEHHFTEFALVSYGNTHVVMKRNYESYRTLHQLPPDISLLYCIRHPFDCLTSPNTITAHGREFHITADRWIGEFAGLQRLEFAQPKRDVCFIRYEDLVGQPAEVEAGISSFLRVGFDKSFGTYQALFSSSMGKWLKDSHRRDYLKSLPDKIWPHLRLFANRFGYDVSLT